jgi:GTP cyclohydrolase IA
MTAESQVSVDALTAAGRALGDLDVSVDDWAAVSPRVIDAEQWQRFEGYVKEIFTAFGMSAETIGTTDTPRRFLRVMFDATGGYEGDEKLVTAFLTECHGAPTAVSARS